MQLDQVFLLHSAPYKEHAALVRGFSEAHGVVTAVLQGVYSKTAKAGRLRAALQVGNLLEWQWRSHLSGLNYLNQCEVLESHTINEIKPLLCLSYINELLLYLLPESQASPPLFNAYQTVLDAIQSIDDVEILLREYERLLFSEMGWTINFSWDEGSQQSVMSQQQYIVHPDYGVQLYQVGMQGVTASGEALEKLSRREYHHADTKRLAKHIHRMMIDHHLSGRKIKSRHLYRQL